ncbi:MAG: hypothetical protein IMF07_00095 [Proteobacteria bacterium]|nr:hypothetical protein [Pseudomonadota bacterium]
MEENQTKKVLPVFYIIKSAVVASWNQSAYLTKSLFIMTTSLVFIQILYDIQPTTNIAKPIVIAKIVIQSVIYTLFAITCHRIILLGPNSVSIYGVLKWSKREWQFIRFGLIVAFFFILIYIVGLVLFFMSYYVFPILSNNKVGTIVSFTAMTLASLYMISRLCVLFPATAIDKKIGVNTALDLTIGNGWRLVVVFTAFPLVSSLFIAFLTGKHLLIDIIVYYLSYALIAVEISALSLSYKYLVETDEDKVNELELNSNNYNS